MMRNRWTLGALLALALLLPAVARAQNVPTNCSGTITTGGTAQLLLAADATRYRILVQNLSAAPLGISFTSTTPVIGSAQTFTLVSPFGQYSTPANARDTSAIYIIGATTGQVFSCVGYN